VEPEELERAPALRARGLRPGPTAARGQVPHELVDAPAHAVVAPRGFRFQFSSVTGARRRSFGEDAVQESHGVAELPVHVLGRPLLRPPLLSLSW
jgi:hypothetical protein